MIHSFRIIVLLYIRIISMYICPQEVINLVNALFWASRKDVGDVLVCTFNHSYNIEIFNFTMELTLSARG